MRSVDEWLAPAQPSRTHPAWAARRLTVHLIGDLNPDPAPTGPSSSTPTPWPTAKATAADRAAAEREASRFWTRLARGESVEHMLSDRVWIAGGGRLGLCARDRIVARLAARAAEGPSSSSAPADGRAADGGAPSSAAGPSAADEGTLQLEHARSYDFVALRQILPGGVAEALAARMPMTDARAVCIDLDADMPSMCGRYTLIMGWAAGRWSIRSLPLAPLDLDWLAGTPVSADEMPAIRTAHTVVRALVLGQHNLLRAARHQLADEIETPDGPRPADTLISPMATPRFDRLGWVIGPATAGPPSAGARALQDRVQTRARRRRGAWVPIWVRARVLRVVGDDLEELPEWEVMVVLEDDRHGFTKDVPRVVGLCPGVPLD